MEFDTWLLKKTVDSIFGDEKLPAGDITITVPLTPEFSRVWFLIWA